MKNTLIVLGILGALALGVFVVLISTYNGMVGQEKAVTAVWRDSQVQYDSFWKKVKETAQVPDQYKEAFKEVFLASVEARYKDKDPAFQFITESNPALDPTMYIQVQRVIEAGRNDFAQTQRTLVDRQRAFETNLATFPNNTLAGVFGFPHELHGEYAPKDDVDGDGLKTVLDYRTVTSAKTQDAFATGREDEPLEVFGSNK